MYTTGLALSILSLLTATVTAAPINATISDIILKSRDTDTFQLHVFNNCPFEKSVALYQIAQPSFTMIQKSTPTTIKSKKSITIDAPYKALGMRLSGHAEWGTAAQWGVQALFEFGWASFMGKEGTAYNLSVMKGSDQDIGIAVHPLPNGRGSKSCESKVCSPSNCPEDQGWTDPSQDKIGSPADTVCYKGKTAFKVVFCP